MRVKAVAFAVAALCVTAASAAPLTQLAYLTCPVEGQCGTGIGARVKGAGRYLYTATAWGMKVYDIRIPAAPVLVTTVPSITLQGDVLVAGRYLYVVTAGTVQVADAKDPAAPVPVGSVSFAPPQSGSFAAMSGKYVFAGLSVVDVGDPAAPVWAGSLPISGTGFATGIAISGTNAYVTDRTGRVHVLDVSDPTAAVETGYLDLAEPAYDIAISGTYAYVVTHDEYCDDEGCTHMAGHLHVLDISGPSCPRVVSSIGRPKAPEGILVSGGYAYIAEQSTNFYFAYGELTVVDVTNPAAPLDVAWAGNWMGYAPQGIAMAGNAVYVTSPWNIFVYGAFTSAPPTQCQ